ncbi:MAG: hypothetical protein HY868_24135 [Chloroflexi bacterium]|nr:hypothetical protein [Chloroflexota bacterium]
MKKTGLSATIVLLVLGLILFGLPNITQVAAQRPRGAQLAAPVKPVSFDGDVRALPRPRAPEAAIEMPRPRRATTTLPTLRALTDPVRQRTSNAPRAATSPLRSFKGLDRVNWGAGWPSDPNGDVGPNHYIQMVNTSVGIYAKDGTQLAAFRLNTFFSNAPAPCNTSNRGDVIVLYDASVDRWIVSDFAWTNIDNGPYYECIAVSKTGDPVSGGWWQYALLAHSSFLNDYPKLGVWRDGIYMSANLFDIFGGGAFGIDEGIRVWALNRNELINGSTLNAVYFDLAPGYNTLLPANVRGAMPPGGTPEFFATIRESNAFVFWKFAADWNTPLNSTFTGPITRTVADFVMPCGAATIYACVPQLNGEGLDGLGDRLMMQLQYRNIAGTESLWANHTVAADANVGTPTGIRWYEIRDPNGAASVYQQSTFQPDSNYRWMGGLAVDQFGNMALGYSVSSASMYPAIRYTGRLASDPLNTLTQGEISLIDGTGAQINGFNRWGDYSAMTVDPVDDCTFWYTNQYYETTSNLWQTRIGSFMLPGCPHIYYLIPILKNEIPH